MSTTPSDLDTARVAQTFAGYGNRYDWPNATKIGAGGFGAVWKVHDTWLDHDVAIKISNQPLVDEIRMCREIDGRTVRIYDYLRGTGAWNAFSMELLDGHWMTLQGFIRKHKYKVNDLQHYLDCFEIMRDVLKGLDEIHGQPWARANRFVHADIKPQNLIVGISPKKHKASAFRMAKNGSLIKIIDLGVATDQGLYPAGFTPSYAYPKAGVARPGHDLYSLAMVFLQVLTKDLPDHKDMKNKARIRNAVSKCSSGSIFLDKVATELTRRCARASTQPITAKSVLDHLKDELFSLDAPHLLALKSIGRRTKSGLKKGELSALIFADMAPHFGWRNQSRLRLGALSDLIADMYSRGMLVRDGQKYYVR